MPNLKPGSNQGFPSSMADAMERAFNQLLHNDGKAEFPIDSSQDETKDRRRLFSAIAQGVVAYLRDNPDAFHIADLNTDSEHITIYVQTDNMVV